MAGLRSGVPGGDFFSLSASRSSATLRPGVSATRVGQHGSAPHLGARAELSAEGGSGAHRAPGTPAPAFGTVCLVLISASPATQPPREPAPRVLSPPGIPARIPGVPQPGQRLDAGCRPTGTRPERHTRGQAPAREGAAP